MKIKIIFFNYNFLFYSFVGFSQFFDNLKIVTKRGKYNFHISDELLWKITQIPQYRFEVMLRNFVRLDNIFQLICQWYKNFSYFWVFFRIFSQSYRVLRLFWHTSKFLLNPLNVGTSEFDSKIFGKEKLIQSNLFSCKNLSFCNLFICNENWEKKPK